VRFFSEPVLAASRRTIVTGEVHHGVMILLATLVISFMLSVPVAILLGARWGIDGDPSG
jgi:hypothetical protein